MEPGKQYTGEYANLTSRDIIEWCRPLLETNAYHLRAGDGKLICTTHPAWNTPWHHVKQMMGLNCFLWHQLMFNNIFPRIPGGEKWVPAGCHNCFKVVVRPPTLKALHALLALQLELDRPSKCGCEIRPQVHGNWGGYFYNWGMDAGIQCYKDIRKAVSEWDGLGKDVPVILKRACTEFEMKIPNSHEWEIQPGQIEAESVITNLVEYEQNYSPQSAHQLIKVHRMWIEHAFSVGDPTYAEFTDGQPLFKPYVTFHHLAEEKPIKLANKRKKKDANRSGVSRTRQPDKATA